MSSAEAVVKISVIITAYNRKDYLLNAAKSAADQTLSKDLYEVVVVKNFEDKQIDGYIRRLGFKNVVYDTPRYGEQVAVGIEESSGDVLAFLDDDDEFEREKLSEVYKAFSKYREISYFHDTRKFIYYNNVVDANVSNPLIKSIVEFHERIVPHYDVVLSPSYKYASYFLARYPGILATQSLMSIKRACIESRLNLLKRIHILGEDFFSAFAAECGPLYHTGKRLTKYRIHDKNVSIDLTQRDQIRMSLYYMKAVEDLKLILANISPTNMTRRAIEMRLLRFKYSLYYAPDNIKPLLGITGFALEAFKDTLKLCKLATPFLGNCILSLLGVLYISLPVKPLSRQTLKKALRHGT